MLYVDLKTTGTNKLICVLFYISYNMDNKRVKDIKFIQQAIYSKCIECELQYNYRYNGFYVSVTLYYPDGTSVESEAKKGETFEIDENAIAALIKIQCRHTTTYYTREYYHIG